MSGSKNNKDNECQVKRHEDKSCKYAIEPQTLLCYLKSWKNKLSWQWEGMTFPVDEKEIWALMYQFYF